MRVRYFIDPETGEPHIYKHGVVEAEVEEVLRRPAESRSGSEDSRLAIGQTLAGRILRVRSPTASSSSPHTTSEGSLWRRSAADAGENDETKQVPARLG